MSGLFGGFLRMTRGDIRNAGAGVVWDRSLSNSHLKKTATSPAYLGSTDNYSYFAALKFESGDFKLVYKYDRNDDHGTPEGTAFIGWDKALGGGLPLGAFIASRTICAGA